MNSDYRGVIINTEVDITSQRRVGTQRQRVSSGTSADGRRDGSAGGGEGVVSIKAIVIATESDRLACAANGGVGEGEGVGAGTSGDAAGDHRLGAAASARHRHAVSAISRISVGTERDVAGDR